MRWFALFLLFTVSPLSLLAQGTQADYDRAFGLREKFNPLLPRTATVEPTWYDDGTFSYERGPKKELILVDPAKATRTEVKADDLKEKKAAAKPEAPGNRPRRGPGRLKSPDGKLVVVFKDHGLWLKNDGEDDDKAVRLADGAEADKYERVYWNADSKFLMAVQVKSGGDRKVTLVESTPKTQLQPKTKTLSYLKPGDDIPTARLRLFDVTTKKQVEVSNELCKTPWDISYETWGKDGRFYCVYNQRGHQVMRVLAIDTAGQVTPVVNEECKTFFDYAYKLYFNLLEKNELLWMSERDGWNHLYLIDTATNAVKKQITKGDWLIERVENFDAKKRELLLRVRGYHAKQDPYHVHFIRVSLDSDKPLSLTVADGTHTAPRFSPDGNYYLTTYSRVDAAPVTQLRKTVDGTLVKELETTDTTALAKAGWKPPERFVAKGRDDKTDIHGVIYRPTNFLKNHEYPVIESIYAGPQGQFVPKGFQAIYGPMILAELGFIVVQIDGMGTNWRSKAFHDVCWKNLGDSGFPDRMKWIKAAAAKYPEFNLSNGVGIYGGSAGGQSSTRAVLAHPDFYTVAVSDCGCHDNRLDKVWWNELWMSWPVGPHYAEQSNSNPEMVKRLKGKLMLVVGEMDENVDPASTLQVVAALIKANKDFDFLMVPGGGHGAGESPYGQRRRADFFVRHLMGVEPRQR
jgi:dipeptidyl-peptidase 4